MNRLVNLIGMTAGGWLGWWVGSLVSLFAAFIVVRSNIPTFHPADAEAARKYLQQEEGRLVKTTHEDAKKKRGVGSG